MSAGHCVSRSVRDSAALLDASQGAAIGDAYAAPPRERPYLEELDRKPGRLRIAWMKKPVLPAEVAPEVTQRVLHHADVPLRPIGPPSLRQRVDRPARGVEEPQRRPLLVLRHQRVQVLVERVELVPEEERDDPLRHARQVALRRAELLLLEVRHRAREPVSLRRVRRGR